ncbi:MULTISPECIES: YbaK/EbsC family protein [unclassified Streptomyces]|uniref:aminoacyl-tRNA deacylase n=1 Tax=unclassified Streptomyces TaxID=2593676 RepID=UPI0034502F07
MTDATQLPGQIEERLTALGIEYRLMHHEATTTSAESARVRGVSLSSGAKAMVVKAADTYSLFVIPADRRLNWKPVKRLLGSKSARLASADELLERTGLTKGSVPPFGNLVGLPVYVDHALLDEPLVRFNAGSLVCSIEMPGTSLLEAVEGEPGEFAEQ